MPFVNLTEKNLKFTFIVTIITNVVGHHCLCLKTFRTEGHMCN